VIVKDWYTFGMPNGKPIAKDTSMPPSNWDSEPGKSKMSQAGRARSAILDLIVSGRISAGEPLQERRLAEWLDMSRTPIRDALSYLEAESVVERRGKMLIVRPISVQEIKEVFAVREMLESYAAGQAAGRIDLGKIEALSQRIIRLGRTPDLQAEEHWEVDDEVHHLVSQGSGNTVLMRIVSDLRRRTRIFDLDRVPERLGPGCDEHLTILKALASGNAEAASMAMKVHIHNARQSIFDKLFEV